MPALKAGRPTSFSPRFSDLLIAHMGSGYSFESFAGKIGVCRQTLYNWVEKYPDFLDAKERGQSASLLFWETLLLRGLLTGKNDRTLNSSLFAFAMRNLHQWRLKDSNPELTEISLPKSKYRDSDL